MSRNALLAAIGAVAVIAVLAAGFLAYGPLTGHHGSGEAHVGMADGAMSMDHDGMAAGTSDRAFVDMMIPHHQGAIDMANVVLERGTRPELRAFAQSIIASQGREIELMRSWQTAWPDADSEMAGDHAMAGMDEMMMSGMSAEDLARADDVDLAFVEAMIPHHEGAVMMAGHVLASTKRPEVRELAQAIIATQQAEIAQMRAWRDAWTG